MAKIQTQSSRVEEVIDRVNLEAGERPGTHGECVYVLRFGDGPLKFGFSANIGARLRVIAASHWEPLTVLGAALGSRAAEKAIHGMLAADRIGRTEWFRPSDRVIAYARKLAEGCLPEGVSASIELAKSLDIEGLFIGTRGNPCPKCGFTGDQAKK